MTVSIATHRRRLVEEDLHVELRVYAGPDPDHRAYAGTLTMRQDEATEFETRMEDPSLGHLDEYERRQLAMHARYMAAAQEDVRYWASDPAERVRRLQRWRAIADMFHPDPFGLPTEAV